MSHSRIAVALPLDDKNLAPLHALESRFDWSHVQEVHFIHIVKRSIAPYEFGMVEVPDEEGFNEMKPTLEDHLKREAHRILPPDFKGQIFYHLKRDFNPEEEMNELLRSLDISLLIVATAGHRGWQALFHDSFSKTMLNSAPCDVYIARPEQSV